MSDGLRRRIEQRLKELGISPRAASLAAGLGATAVRDIFRRDGSPTLETMRKLAKALQTTPEWLAYGEAGEPPPVVREVLEVEDAPAPPKIGPRNVPVYGLAVGGDESTGDFRLNGQTVDYAPRPSGIAQRRDVYALHVMNDSMSPKYEAGDRVYVDPHRPPKVGDYVIVELHGESDGEPGAGYIKRLVRRTSDRVVVSQFNPPAEIEFERRAIKDIHRVIPWDELLGT